MCGFIALYNPAGLKPEPVRWRAARDRLRHRGPDDAGEFSARDVWFGFRRLSILDPTPAGHQPMLDEAAQVALMFNGQIYNYRDLRTELEAAGHRFRSHCDTEVVLKAYVAWGKDAFRRLRGMWAIMIWDGRANTLTVSRDRFGIKPLYRRRGATTVYASEVKAILAVTDAPVKPHLPSLQRYMARFWLDYTAETLFEGIEQVAPATVEQWRDGKLVHRERFWSPPRPSHTRDDPCDLLAAIVDTVGRHMQSDVPVAAALSGGLDSSTIVSVLARNLDMASQLHCFSVRAADIPDESPWIDETVRLTGVSHEYLDLEATDYVAAIDAMLAAHDEPTFSAGQVNQYVMRREIGKRGYKVLLVGDGADEILGGYAKCIHPFVAALLEEGYCAEARGAIGGSFDLTGRGVAETLARQRLYAENGLGKRMVQEFRLGYDLMAPAHRPDDAILFPELDHAQLEGRPPGAEFFRELLDRLTIDFPMTLRNEDRNGMAHSIEVRPVFMDHTILETAWTYSYRDFMRGGVNKQLLRRAVDGVVAPSVAANRRKFVRPGSAAHLVYDALYEPMMEMLEGSRYCPDLWADDLTARYRADRERRSVEAAIVWMRFYQMQRWMALYMAGPVGWRAAMVQ